MSSSNFFSSKVKLLAVFCFLVFLASLYSGINKHKANNYKHTLIWDAEGYYLYLPAIFINHGFENLNVQTKINDIEVYKPYPGTNKVFTKYTCGVALIESPFFLLARAYCALFGSDSVASDYYVGPYMVSIIVADSFYLALGLFILGILLLNISSLFVTVSTLLIIWLGTNLLYYTSYAIGASHVCSFFLIGCFITIVPIMYKRWMFQFTIIAAILFGLIVLVRPTNIVVGFYFVLYDVYTISQLKARVRLLIGKWRHLLIFPVLGFIVFTPQFIYWHYISGHYLLYSYQEEGFVFWNNPKIFSVLFSPLNGFFLYAPLMLLSMAGLVYSIKKRVLSCWAVLAIFCTTDYICGSWWFWNFGTSYGFRPFIDFFPILALQMAFFLRPIAQWRFPAKAASILCILFFIFLSIRLQKAYIYTWQGDNWGWADVTRIYKEALFFKQK